MCRPRKRWHTTLHPLYSGAQISPYKDALIERYTTRTQRSLQLEQAPRTQVTHAQAASDINPHAQAMRYPLAIASASGSRINDIDGNEYVDLTMGFGANLWGYSPAFVVEAMHTHLKSGIEPGLHSPLVHSVAASLCAITGMDRAIILSTGAQAISAAFQAARTITGRSRIAVFANSRRDIPDDALVLDFGDPLSLELLQEFGDELAGVFVEPVQHQHSELQPAAFLRSLSDTTTRTGTVLIFDEEIGGFRLHPRGAQGFFGVQADMAVYGGVIGGAMPLSVLAGKSIYMDAIDIGARHDQTDQGAAGGVTTRAGESSAPHPLSLAAAEAILNHLQRSGALLQQELNARASRLVLRLNNCFSEQRVAIRLEHCGSILHFTFPDTNETTQLFLLAMREKGVHIRDRSLFFPLHTRMKTSHSSSTRCRSALSSFAPRGCWSRALAFHATPPLRPFSCMKTRIRNPP